MIPVQGNHYKRVIRGSGKKSCQECSAENTGLGIGIGRETLGSYFFAPNSSNP